MLSVPLQYVAIFAMTNLFSAAFNAAQNTPLPNGARHNNRPLLFFYVQPPHRRRQARTGATLPASVLFSVTRYESEEEDTSAGGA